MINPRKITNYFMDDYQLQENILFWILVAGKTASTTAKSLEIFLTNLDKGSSLPFEKIKKLGEENLNQKLQESRIGCYNQKSKTIWQLINSNLDLRICSTEDLEKIYGIGRKTSRCFLIHSRKEARYAGLDTHILKFLKEKGHDVPMVTPQNKKKYFELENIFLTYVDKSGKSVAEFDLDIWNNYAN